MKRNEKWTEKKQQHSLTEREKRKNNDDNKVMSERNIDDYDKKSLKINNEISTHSFTAVSFWVFFDTQHSTATDRLLFDFDMGEWETRKLKSEFV